MIDLVFQKRINHELEKFFIRKQREAVRIDKRIPLLIDQIADLTLRGGDRQRPYFCYLGYQITQPIRPRQTRPGRATHNLSAQGRPASGWQPTTIMPVLLALELFHSFALIHDDITDEADLRRGGPTIHAYFTQNLRNVKLASSLAILAGDLCAQWAQELFDEITPPNPLLKRGGEGELRQLFNKLREEVMYGQIRDSWGMRGSSIDEIRQMYRQKSGNYSVEKPLLLGATLAGGSPGVIERLSDYGQAVGLAFQLKDDLLGVFGKEEKTGKSVSSDIKEAKWTLLVALTASGLDIKDRHKLMGMYEKPPVRTNDTDWVKEKMKVTGAKEQVEQEMGELVVIAKRAVTNLLPESRTKLARIAEFIITRDS